MREQKGMFMSRGTGTLPARTAGIALAGALAAIGVGWVAGAPARDLAGLVLLTASGAVVAGVIGAGVLWTLRESSIGVQAVVVALVSLTTCVGGVLTASAAMFVSAHDLGALMVIIVIAATAGAIAALVLGAISAKLAEARFRERRQEAARRELVAWVSHDLRTPLAGVRAMVEALEDGVVTDSATVMSYYRAIGAETEQLARLVDDLFELSRVNSGALQLNRERLPLAELVSDAVAGAATTARAKDIELDTRTSGPLPVLNLDASGVTRAVRNLLDNAIRHTPRSGRVLVETGSFDGHVFVSVADACGGIPVSDLDRVFDLAFRGDESRTRADADVTAGAGLGLAIAKGMVEAHEGRIEVANHNGGCRFTVRLPIAGSTA